MTSPSKESKWTGDWRGLIFGAVIGVIVALALAAGYYLLLALFAKGLLYHPRTHIFGWVFCQALLALAARGLFGRYPIIAASGALTSILTLAAAFFILSFDAQVGI